MSQESTWKCVKGFNFFTRGEFYQGQTSATPGGEWAMSFLDDTEQEHLITSTWLHNHFVKVEPVEVNQLRA